jgi:hypothetical protein
MKSAAIKTRARAGKSNSSLEISKHIIEFSKVRVEPVKPLAPVPACLFRREFQNGKVSRTGLAVRQTGKDFAKKSD